MPATTGGLSNIYTLALNTEIDVPLPTDPGLVDSILLYNYSPYLIVVKTGTAQGWLGAWSVDQFKTGQNSVVKCTPLAIVGQPPNTGQPTVTQLVGAFVLNDEAQEHQGTYPCTLLGRVGPVSATDLHVIGTQTRVDIEPVPATQPTEWFGNIDRSVQSFINAPSSGSPINFMGIAMNSSPWISSLAGGPTVHSRVFCALGTLDIGEIDSNQGAIGGRAQFFDDACQLYFTPGPNSAAFTARVYVEDGHIRLTGNANIGFGYNDADKELQRFNNGTWQNWTALTLQNGWTAKAGYYAPSYRFTPDGMIELSGTMTGGTNADNTIIALMPAVPAKLDIGDAHIAAGGGANKRIFFTSAAGQGQLYCYGVAGATDLGLSGNRFRYK